MPLGENICRHCAGRKVVRRSDGIWVKCNACSGTMTRARNMQEAREGLRRCRTAFETDPTKHENLRFAISRAKNAGYDDLEIRKILKWSRERYVRFVNYQGRMF